MIKVYFSAADFFAALEQKQNVSGMKLSMRAVQRETGINSYTLTKLKRGTLERLTTGIVESLHAYAVAAGVKVQPDKIVRLLVAESGKP